MIFLIFTYLIEKIKNIKIHKNKGKRQKAKGTKVKVIKIITL